MHIELGDTSNSTFCECCGNESKSIWGYAYKDDLKIAVYFVQWTSGRSDHSPNFDFIIGAWGDDKINDRVLASWIYTANLKGGSFMAIDSFNRPAASSELCNKALAREEVVNNSMLMGVCAELLDELWLNDPRLVEITKIGKNA